MSTAAVARLAPSVNLSMKGSNSKVVDENAGARGGPGGGGGRHGNDENVMPELSAWEKENVHPVTGQRLGYSTMARNTPVKQDDKAPTPQRRPFGVLSQQAPPSHDAENRIQDSFSAGTGKGAKAGLGGQENRRPMQASARSFR